MKPLMSFFYFETFDAKLTDNLYLVVHTVLLYFVRTRDVVEVIAESSILAVVERSAGSRTNIGA